MLGNAPVRTREYRQGAEARKEQKRLEEAVSYYMTGLEPEGRFAKTRFTREEAEKRLDGLIKQLESMDPEDTQDRWVSVHNGKTWPIPLGRRRHGSHVGRSAPRRTSA